MAGRTKIDDPDLIDLLDGIDCGRVALPNFQRDFDWSDGDVASLLATVLSGWPMGSLLLVDGNEETLDFYAPRPFEFAPDLVGLPDTIVLDGQQRLTSLYTAIYGKSDQVYAVQAADLDWTQIDALDAAIRSFKRRSWDRRYTSPRQQWAERLIPMPALRSAADFYAWRDEAGLTESETLTLSELYRNQLSGLHRYRVPALRIDNETPPAAVARIFERVNKTGQRLGAFDLMVAKSFTPDFNLRTRWEDAKARYPRLDVFYEDDGTVPLQVIALRVLEDVRASAVLRLTATAIHDHWDEAVKALDAALEFAENRLGVIDPWWVPYGNLIIVLAALAWEKDLPRISTDIEAWFWRSAFSGRYAVGSNTTAVADFKVLRTNAASLPRDFSIDLESLLEATKRSSGALHRSWLCALAAAQMTTKGGEPSEFDVRSHLRKGDTVLGQPQHLLTLGFCLTRDGVLLEDGPFLSPPDLASAGTTEETMQFLNARAGRLAEFLSEMCRANVRLARAED